MLNLCTLSSKYCTSSTIENFNSYFTKIVNFSLHNYKTQRCL